MKPQWKSILSSEIQDRYYRRIIEYLKENPSFYPPVKKILRVYDTLDFDEVKVVVLGQDCYHGPSQANGFAFAVNDGITMPPSLRNIFKEVKKEFGACPASTTLEGWSSQGVFLLNSFLTVEPRKPLSHQHIGWDRFTDATIEALGKREEPLVFMLWGAFARKKKHLIENSKHLILEAAHPSPFSVQNFMGCNHFLKANEFLQSNNLEPVDWTK